MTLLQKIKPKPLKRSCLKCSQELAAFPEGSYCSKYCCRCCPHSKTSPCQKEQREGSFLDNFVKWNEEHHNES
jgi:hypothetical protein